MMLQTVQAPATPVNFRLPVATATSGEAAREQWVAFIGKLSLEKGVHCLIAAMPAIIAKAPQARFMLIGDGVARAHLVAMRDALSDGDLDAAARAMQRAAETSPEPYAEWVAEYWAGLDLHQYCKMAAAADLRKRVVFTGYQPAPGVARLISHADLVVIPSLIKEAFPLVSVEALSTGLMFVAPYVGGLAPVLDQVSAEIDPIGRLASLRHYPQRLIPDMIDQVSTLLRYTSQEARRREMAKQCRNFALRHYDWTNIVSRIESVYVSALYGYH